MKLLQMTNEDLQRHANAVLSSVLEKLHSDKYITKVTLKDLKETYAVVIVSEGWLTKTMKKIFYSGRDKDSIFYRTVDL